MTDAINLFILSCVHTEFKVYERTLMIFSSVLLSFFSFLIFTVHWSIFLGISSFFSF